MMQLPAQQVFLRDNKNFTLALLLSELVCNLKCAWVLLLIDTFRMAFLGTSTLASTSQTLEKSATALVTGTGFCVIHIWGRYLFTAHKGSRMRPGLPPSQNVSPTSTLVYIWLTWRHKAKKKGKTRLRLIFGLPIEQPTVTEKLSGRMFLLFLLFRFFLSCFCALWCTFNLQEEFITACVL